MKPVVRHEMSLEDLAKTLYEASKQDWRLGLLTARPLGPSKTLALVTLLIHPKQGDYRLIETTLAPGALSYDSLTPFIPQAHWFERAIWDFFGLRPLGHPRLKSVVLHEAWPPRFHPLRPAPLDDDVEDRTYHFLEVKGEGVSEIPVGPIHAGIIEPGHFRFSCTGEIIENLEIRLGYQHRGIEAQLTEIPWRRARFLAEAASSDTAVGNAWAHAMAIESLFDVTPPVLAQELRAIALEIERIASHLGDLAGISSDIGFAAGATTFARLRGKALGLAERLTGSRFQTAYILPGGVAQPLDEAQREASFSEASELDREFQREVLLLTKNNTALDRMENIGRVRPALARDFGLVGPAGRASGIAYDVRSSFSRHPYTLCTWQPAVLNKGDVHARVQIRVGEVNTSLQLLKYWLNHITLGSEYKTPLPDLLPPNGVGLGLVEAWRGELIHLIFTDAGGRITRYSIKDPSFNNWTGLAIAARGELVSDFPVCNKSFGLSYSGNDL